MKKRIIGLIISLSVLVFGIILIPKESHAQDTSYANDDVIELSQLGILQGDGNGDYMLNDYVTRGQFAAFVSRALRLDSIKSGIQFTDVPTSNVLHDDIYKAATAGIVNGYLDKSFRPNQRISREEMAIMIKRMLDYKGIPVKTAPITFTDKDKITNDDVYLNAIEECVAYGIINGYPTDNSFKPKNSSIRAESVVVIFRALDQIIPDGNYKIAVVSSNGVQSYLHFTYPDFDYAKKYLSNSNEAISLNGKIVGMEDGIVVTNGPGNTNFGDTYVSVGTQLKYVNADDTNVTVQLAGNTGQMPQSAVTLIPSPMVTNISYYTVNDRNDNTLYHHINGAAWGYEYGYAPDFMQPNVKYYSWDGHTFYTNPQMTGQPVGTAYQYYDILPLKTATSYTADQLNQYVVNNIPSTYSSKMGGPGPLATLGQAFINAQNQFGVNAMYLLAHAILESGWGSSDIAQQKYNLFGINAVDSNPYGNADTFNSYQDCIYYMAQFVSQKYQTPGDFRYFGSMLGNKESGMNMKYASDPYWGQKIAGNMFQIDKALGGQDFNKFTLGVQTADSLNARSDASTSAPIVYQYPESHIGAGMIITNEVNNAEGSWYQIISDTSSFLSPQYIYVYHNGQYGLTSNKVVIAK